MAIYAHQSLDVKSAVKIEVGDQLKEPLKQYGNMSSDIAEIKGKIEILDPLGTIRVHGEMWNAESLSGRIEKGRKVRVKRIENLKLYVEPIS